MAIASAWAKPGSWALAAEEQDVVPPPPPPVVPAADFPDLATAASTKVPKKKAQSFPLSEFNSSKFVPRASRGTGTEEMSLDYLPKGPRERTDEELANTRGFGAGRWGGAGGGPHGSDEPRRGGSDREDFGPSRADEADDWGAGKKPFERRERMGGFGGDSSASRADDVDDWVSTKRTPPTPFPERRERGAGLGGDSVSRADDSASWVSSKSYCMPADSRRGGLVWGFNRDGGQDSDYWARREEMSNARGSSVGRPRLNLQKRTLPLANASDGEKPEYSIDKNTNKQEDDEEEQRLRSRSLNPFGTARPREEVLAAKGEVWRKEEPKVEKLEIQPRTRFSNPFGAARPREELLAEKGEDWRKVDEKLEAMKVWEAFGTRGSSVAGEENGNAQLSEARAERAWKKPVAVEAGNESEDGSEMTDKGALAN